MNYHLFISTKRINNKNVCPIYAKISIDNKIYERASGVFIEVNNWSKDFKRIKPTAKDAKRLNEILNDFENKLLQLKQSNANIVDVDKLLNKKINDTESITIDFLVKQYLQKQEKLIGVTDGITKTTFRTYKCKTDNLFAFLKEKKQENLYVNEFTYELGEKYKFWLANKQYSTGHINKCMKFVKTLMRFAQFEYNTNPTNLMLLKLKEAKLKPMVYLTEMELKKVQTHVYLTQIHQKTADLFLLQCFTGMGYADVIKLNSNSLISHNQHLFINYERIKTGVRALVPVLPQVSNILNRYNGTAPVMCNEVYNRILKEIAAICSINKNLTSHVGRKTFACMLVSKGVSMETTTKMLAKTNTRETERIYAEVQYDKILNEMPKFG